jgi:NAD(P)-dependent dehydrogenase (short-subunit alcohol dehydrogenase family)
VSRKTVVITGGRSEVARAAAVALARSGARVVLVSSSASAAIARDEVIKRSGSTDVHLLLADMSLMSSVHELARQINANWHAIAAVIHHGAHHDLRSDKREVSGDGFERFWAHNHLGPFLLTHLLKDGLVKGHGRVITIGSTRLRVYPRLAVDLKDPNYERRSFSATRAFYQSKVAQIQFALALPRHWAGAPVIAKALSVPSVGADTVRRVKLPWYRRLAHTSTGRDRTTPKKIGDLYAVVALSPKVAKLAGGYLDRDLAEAWAPVAVFDVAQQDALWKASVAAVGVG